MLSFKTYALSEEMVKALNTLGYWEPTSIQNLVIPAALRKESIVARSETGSGKTHSFLVPMMDRIDSSKNEIQGLIICPTRELAKQTFDFAKALNEKLGNKISIRLLAPGEEKSRTIEKLKNTNHLIIATPGRLNDLHLNENAIDISNCQYVVLDEADMLMDMGFFEQIDSIVTNIKDPTLMVFSATIPQKLSRFIEKYVHAENIFDLNKENLTNSNVKHYLIDTRHQDVKECLMDFLRIKKPYLCLVFASKKETVDQIYKYLTSNGVKTGIMHGDLEIRQRKQMMRRILNDEFPVVVCSDMAARGLDLDHVSDVVNIDLPKEFEFYFHRAGRTGRYNAEGNCYSFYDNDNTADVQKIIDAGIQVQYVTIKGNEIVEGKPFEKRKFKSNKIDVELQKDIKKAVAKTKSNTVKPGYKKKVRVAVDKAKRQNKRKMIKQDIRKQRVERYKKEAKERRNDGEDNNW